jgi:squalene-associated FAD-dependent desaturase
MRIIVVGGGFAGVSAAVALSEAGHQVFLHEARASLGGRVHSVPPPLGFPVALDNGPHLFSGAYHETFSLLKKLGRENLFHWVDPLKLDWYLLGGKVVSLKATRLPAPFHLAWGLLNSHAFSFREKIEISRTLIVLRRAKPNHQTVAQFLDERKISGNALELFWKPFTRAVANMPPENAPLNALTSTLPRMFLGNRRDSAFAVSRAPSGDLFGDSVECFLKQRQGRLVLRSSIEDVQVQSGRILSAQTTSGETLHADGWVFAVPPSSLSHLLPKETWVPTPESLGTSPIVTAHFYLDQPVLKSHFICLAGSRFEWVFNRNLNWDLMIPGQVLSVLASADKDLANRPEKELLEIAWKEFSERCPRAAQAKRFAERVTKEMSATFAWTPASEALRPPAHTPLSNLALAGDWTATGLPATIESAVQSGLRAASLFH